MPEICNQGRLKVLFLPAWYPSEIHPIAGVFIKGHAKAASLYNDIVVLYAYGDPSPQPKGLYRVSEDIEDGIRTIRVRYGGILAYAKRRLLAAFPKPGRNQGDAGKSDSKSNPALSILKKPLTIPFFIAGDLIYYWSIFATFRRLVKEGWKPDIIHAHVYTAGVPAVILGKLYGIPVVITEHWSGFLRHLLGWLYRSKARFAMNKARIILPVSNALKEAIRAHGIKNEFKIVPNVVNTNIFCPSLPQNKGGDNERKKLLLVAVLTQTKGVSYLLEALCKIKNKRDDFILEIVGDGTHRKEYERLTKELGLEKRVNFHGLKPKGDVAQFMRECDFFVLTGLQETFGVVIIEAMACGKPVIATNAGGPREIVNDDVGILVPPKDVKALKEAIEYMLDNYQNYSSEKIAQYAKERFGYEMVGKMLDEIYRGL